MEESAPVVEARSLRQIYAERKQLISKYVPEEIQAIHARAVTELEQSGISMRALQRGNKAPDFSLPDHTGNVIHTSRLLREGRVIICFFRGRWCPFCVGQLEAMNTAYEDIQKLGASLIAVLPQTAHQSSLMADQHRLHFPLLCDAGNNVARQFGLAYRVPEYQQEVYRRVFVNLPFVNGDASWELPIPATYVVDRDGTVLYSFINPDYTERPEPADILHFLSQLP